MPKYLRKWILLAAALCLSLIHICPIGGAFLAAAITVFAWTTIIGMYYSCAKSVNYAFGDTLANRREMCIRDRSRPSLPET